MFTCIVAFYVKYVNSIGVWNQSLGCSEEGVEYMIDLRVCNSRKLINQ